MTQPTSTARLFLAIWPDDETLNGLVARRNAIEWESGAKVSPDERLHLTLHFIGQVPRDRVPALREALQVHCDEIELTLSWLDVWKDGVAVLRPQAVPPSLMSLRRQLSQRLNDVGLPVEEREFRPHVTLARNAPGAADPLGQPLLWRSRGYALVESLGGYHIVERFP